MHVLVAMADGTSAYDKVDLTGNEIVPAGLNRSFPELEELIVALEDGGQGANALAGGKFEPKPVQSKWAQMALLLGIVMGYADLGFDVQVTCNWFLEGKLSLFALSVACLLLPVFIQWMFVDRTPKRAMLTFFQLKLLVDGWASFFGGEITPGYGTAKFAEAVYEASIEGILQSYEALNQFKAGKELELTLVVSVLLSLNSIAWVLLLFQTGHMLLNFRTKVFLYFYHVAALGFRTLSFALLGFAMHAYSFPLAMVCLAVRAGLYYFMNTGANSNMHMSMVVASVLIDSVWADPPRFRAASVLTFVEGILITAIAAKPMGELPGSGHRDCILLLSMLFIVKMAFWRVFLVQLRASLQTDMRVHVADAPEDDIDGTLKEKVQKAVLEKAKETGAVASFAEALTDL